MTRSTLESPGSVDFVGQGLALAGDAVFAGSIGRTDLPGGDTNTLLASIRDQLLSLPDETVVHPARPARGSDVHAVRAPDSEQGLGLQESVSQLRIRLSAG